MSARKRLRPDDWDDIEPSPVLHVRGLPEHTLELDLIEAFEAYGSVKEISIMPDKGQALVEFVNLSSSENAVITASREPIVVANHRIKVNFSTSKRIVRRGAEENGRDIGIEFDESHVLIITVYNAQYPITANVIQQICSIHGRVLRIVILRRALIKAMVEFESTQEARNVKKHINGADIYSGCCSLKVDFAKPTRLRVTQNNDDTFDYENPSFSDSRGGNDRINPSLLGHYEQSGGSSSRRHDGRRSRHNNVDDIVSHAPPIPGLPYDIASTFFNRLINGGSAASALPQLSEAHPYTSVGNNPSSNGDHGASSSVLMVYNMDLNVMNCDRLFNLLCLYGNVVRIKFLRTKEGSAMAQMGDTYSVVRVIQNLSGAVLMDKQLSIRPSKQQMINEVSEPYRLPDGAPSYCDYLRSRNNRFVDALKASKNRIYPPSATLHYWNCPPELTTDDVRNLFDIPGCPAPIKIASFPQVSNRSSSGLIEWPNQDDAVLALALINHLPVHSPTSQFPYILKLSFSNSPVLDRSRRERSRDDDDIAESNHRRR